MGAALGGDMSRDGRHSDRCSTTVGANGLAGRGSASLPHPAHFVAEHAGKARGGVLHRLELRGREDQEVGGHGDRGGVEAAQALERRGGIVVEDDDNIDVAAGPPVAPGLGSHAAYCLQARFRGVQRVGPGREGRMDLLGVRPAQHARTG
jgi:hypothetical protein